MRRGVLQILVPILAICVQGYLASDVKAFKRTVPKFNPYKVQIAPADCFDRTEGCDDMVEKGYCVSNFKYMLERCPLSCRLCKTAEGDIKECRDQNDKCKAWAAHGDCTLYKDFMGQNCKSSCELCETDKDQDNDTACPGWAKKGLCLIHPLHLGVKCSHSCNKYRTVKPRYFYPPTLIPGSFMAQPITDAPKPPAPPQPPKPIFIKKEKTEAEKLKEKNDAELARELEEQDKEEELEERAEAWREKVEEEKQKNSYSHILQPLQEKTFNSTSGTLNKIEGPPLVPLQEQPPAPEPLSPEQLQAIVEKEKKEKELKRLEELAKAKKHKKHKKHHHKHHHKHHKRHF